MKTCFILFTDCSQYRKSQQRRKQGLNLRLEHGEQTTKQGKSLKLKLGNGLSYGKPIIFLVARKYALLKQYLIGAVNPEKFGKWACQPGTETITVNGCIHATRTKLILDFVFHAFLDFVFHAFLCNFCIS